MIKKTQIMTMRMTRKRRMTSSVSPRTELGSSLTMCAKVAALAMATRANGRELRSEQLIVLLALGVTRQRVCKID